MPYPRAEVEAAIAGLAEAFKEAAKPSVTTKGDLQRNQRDRDAYLRNSGLDWSIGRGGILTDEPGGRADIRITPPVHRLSLFRRVARADFARALIAAADAPAASARTFDVFNEPGAPPTDTELAGRLEQLSKSS